MCALNHLTLLFRGTSGKLRRLAWTETGSALQLAATTIVLSIAGGLDYLVDQLQLTWARLRLLSRDDAGYTTQTVIMTALLAALAIAAGAIIYTKVIDKANSINLDGNTGSP